MTASLPPRFRVRDEEASGVAEEVRAGWESPWRGEEARGGEVRRVQEEPRRRHRRVRRRRVRRVHRCRRGGRGRSAGVRHLRLPPELPPEGGGQRRTPGGGGGLRLRELTRSAVAFN